MESNTEKCVSHISWIRTAAKKKCDGKNTGQSRLTAENTPRFGRCHTNRLSWIGIRPTFVPGRPKHANLDLCGRFFFFETRYLGGSRKFGRAPALVEFLENRIWAPERFCEYTAWLIVTVHWTHLVVFFFKIFTDDITHFRQCRKSLWTSLFQMEWNNDRTAGDRRGEGGDVNADLHCSSEYDIKLGT